MREYIGNRWKIEPETPPTIKDEIFEDYMHLVDDGVMSLVEAFRHLHLLDSGLREIICVELDDTERKG